MSNCEVSLRYIFRIKYLLKCLFDLAVTVDLLTSKSNQFIFVSNCTYAT